MARRLRIQYPGAIYHVINRGNYRLDVFGSVGAAQAFEAVLDEGCEMFGWVVHAYVLMRNHFHLALETPQPNLVDGMHWVQSTYATRFNRFRSESGHLFQGRYQSLLVEYAAALVRVGQTRGSGRYMHILDCYRQAGCGVEHGRGALHWWLAVSTWAALGSQAWINRSEAPNMHISA